jgi:hypothetical protein
VPRRSRDKSGRKIDAVEAVKRVEKSLKQQTGTPPKPYEPAPPKSSAAKKPQDNGTSLKALKKADETASRKAAKSSQRLTLP